MLEFAGEAIVLGHLTRVPVLIKVGQRVSAEGGSDIDVTAALEAARTSRDTERMARTGAFATPFRQERKEEI